jgi:hypothetical protein
MGSYSSGTSGRTLIEHRNGKMWKHMVSSNPGGSSQGNGLSSVAATSAPDVWAVGTYESGAADQALALRCC